MRNGISSSALILAVAAFVASAPQKAVLGPVWTLKDEPS